MNTDHDCPDCAKVKQAATLSASHGAQVALSNAKRVVEALFQDEIEEGKLDAQDQIELITACMNYSATEFPLVYRQMLSNPHQSQ